MTDTPATEKGVLFWAKRLWPLLLLIAGAVLVFAMGWHRYLSMDSLVSHREELRQAIAGNTLVAMAIFMMVYAAAVALSLPGGAALTLTGGFLFGWFLGGLVSLVAALAGAVALFLIARSAVGEALAARAGPWLKRLSAGFQEDAFNYLLFLRLVPVFPFWLVNLAPAVLGVGLGTYALATLIGIVPGTFAYAIAGSGLDSIIEAQQAAHQSCLAKLGADAEKSCAYQLEPRALLTPEFIAGLVALGIVALIPVAVKRFRSKTV
jgi:uncharacterized membrane protein YdjX (TVP38/TMEM64 family)